MHYPMRIVIREVSPRDGLQAEKLLSTNDKARLIDSLADAGFTRINAVSFVSPKAVPQMADGDKVMARINRRPGVTYDATVPNLRGLQRALDARMDAVVVFVTASEAGSRSNLNRSSEESLREAAAVVTQARSAGLEAVGTISSAFGSPYGEEISTGQVLAIANRLVAAGATSLALGDTSGEAVPSQVAEMAEAVMARHPEVVLSLHLHDTRGLALANVVAGMDVGVTHFDAAVGGIGGSPFTRNSAGNLATEDLLSMCNRMGIETGVQLPAVLGIHDFLTTALEHPLPGKVAKVGREPVDVA